MSADNLPLNDLRNELYRLVALAGSAERPKPTQINPADHSMPVSDARRLAMALLAAADRADSVSHGVTSLGAWRTQKTETPERKQMT
jgi:hypothetical protein